MQLPASKKIDGVDIDGIHFRSVVGQHCRQWSTDNFRPIDNGYGLPLHLSPNGFTLVKTRGQRVQYLHHRQCRARQDAFLGIPWKIDEPNVPVQIRSILVTQALHIALDRDGISQIIVLALAREGFDLSEYGIVHNYAMHSRIIVGIPQCRFDVDGVFDCAQFVTYAVGTTGLAGPFGILSRGGIGVGEQADEEGGIDAGRLEFADLIPNLLAKGGGDDSRIDFFGAGSRRWNWRLVGGVCFVGCHGRATDSVDWLDCGSGRFVSCFFGVYGSTTEGEILLERCDVFCDGRTDRLCV